MMSATGAVTESTALSLPTAAPEATASIAQAPQAQMMLRATPEPTEPTLDQRALPAAEPPAPVIDPLRVVEIALLALAVVLGVATLVARRKQV